ncbi:hypothetical protein, partial [Achromobacter xylosoxidans]|uniref:hypothetical protein n=1 Tax=Alcaligenes xylosoxydans xylosoxydans TaxID=85698 RepID=UPI001F1401F1
PATGKHRTAPDRGFDILHRQDSSHCCALPFSIAFSGSSGVLRWMDEGIIGTNPVNVVLPFMPCS